MKSKSFLKAEKNIIKSGKTSYYNYQDLFSFRKSTSFSKSNKLENSFEVEEIKAKCQDALLRTEF